MSTRLLQIDNADGGRFVAVLGDTGDARRLNVHVTVYDLARTAISASISLMDRIATVGLAETIDLAAAEREGRIRAPIDHPDPAHLLVTGTGLTHLGSAEGRDKMHRDLNDAAALTDSMKMFRLGLDNGKPAEGQTGVQPEWFYKGDGSVIAAPGQPLRSPAFALDGGEEPELAGIYINGPDGTPWRIGFAIGNEFSDHVTERQNYLYLAHSKLRRCALGPELLIGDLPQDIRGVTRIRRDGEILWEKPFLTGEANMSHSIANLEHHHFKYDLFQRPGDANVHFMGTATLSFSDGISARPGDVFEIEAAPFRLPLRNPLQVEAPSPVRIRQL